MGEKTVRQVGRQAAWGEQKEVTAEGPYCTGPGRQGEGGRI